jgi:ATP-dependent DNA helicase DinG
MTSYIDNFPFATLRQGQSYILKEIASDFEKDYRYIILEAPTGTGKSPIAIASALSEGSSYICTSTKNLQTQYKKDFPFLQLAKGRNNFTCPKLLEQNANVITADFGPCVGDSKYKCPLKTRVEDYYTMNTGTTKEIVLFNRSTVTKRRTLDYEEEYDDIESVNILIRGIKP